jgi:hypothetical protein
MKFLNKLKFYSHKEVVRITKETMIATANGTIDWIRHETDIVDKDTRAVIENSEITTRKDSKKTMDYIIVELNKRGIHPQF